MAVCLMTRKYHFDYHCQKEPIPRQHEVSTTLERIVSQKLLMNFVMIDRSTKLVRDRASPV